MKSKERIELKPIGIVKRKTVNMNIKDRKNVSEIILSEDFTDALEGIGDFSHLFVLFWMHETTKMNRKTRKVHPRGRKDMPFLGVFATRTSHRPNPIGLTLVELLKVERNILTVRGLDAFNGTPILDIKPFDYWDINQYIKVPEWWKKLEKRAHCERGIVRYD